MLDEDGDVVAQNHGRKKVIWTLVATSFVIIFVISYFGFRNWGAKRNAEIIAVTGQLRPLPRDQWIGALDNSCDPCAVLEALGDGFVRTAGEHSGVDHVVYFDRQNQKPFEYVWIVDISSGKAKVIDCYKKADLSKH